MEQKETHSPLFIRVALHYWYSPQQWCEVERQSPASDEVHSQLETAGLLDFENGKWSCVTEAMKVYVDALCAIPLPVRAWGFPTNS